MADAHARKLLLFRLGRGKLPNEIVQHIFNELVAMVLPTVKMFFRAEILFIYATNKMFGLPEAAHYGPIFKEFIERAVLTTTSMSLPVQFEAKAAQTIANIQIRVQQPSFIKRIRHVCLDINAGIREHKRFKGLYATKILDAVSGMQSLGQQLSDPHTFTISVNMSGLKELRSSTNWWNGKCFVRNFEGDHLRSRAMRMRKVLERLVAQVEMHIPTRKKWIELEMDQFKCVKLIPAAEIKSAAQVVNEAIRDLMDQKARLAG